jgi:hypothetical protein
MTTWLVEYCPYLKSDPDAPELGHEIPCFRIFPADNPENWIAQTNEDLPRDVQEEAAVMIAAALSNALGKFQTVTS